MRGFVKFGSEAGQAAVRTVDPPQPGPGQARVRVAACGICGSDLHAYQSDAGYEFVNPPVVLGHEFAGTVDAVGAGVESVAVGDPVVAVSIQGCLRCATCRSGDTQLCLDRRIIGLSYDGGVAEAVVVPEGHLVPVSAGLDLTTAALTEPLSVAVHAVLGRSAIVPGQRVVVTGPGPIGLLSGRLAQLRGGDVYMVGAAADAARRLPIAESMGMRVVEAGDSLADQLGGPVDAWIEASGAGPALNAALQNVRRGGVITVVSLFARPMSFFPTDAVRAELTILFSYGSAYADYVRGLELLASGAVDAAPLIDVYDLDDAGEAFEAALAGRAVKPLIQAGGPR